MSDIVGALLTEKRMMLQVMIKQLWTINEKNPSAIINIKQPGLYTINCEIYLSTTGEVLGDAMYQPLVEN